MQRYKDIVEGSYFWYDCWPNILLCIIKLMVHSCHILAVHITQCRDVPVSPEAAILNVIVGLTHLLVYYQAVKVGL